jgi:hypothetical protein
MRTLNKRQKLFLETLVNVGFYEALKLSGYAKSTGYFLLGEKKAKDYLMSYVQDEIAKLNLSYSDVLKRRLELAEDIDTPAKVRDDIYKDLGAIIKAAQEDVSETTDIKRLPFLKPAQQLKQAETVEAKEVKTE